MCVWRLFTRFVWVVDIVWEDCVWVFDAVGVDCAQMVILFVWDVWKNMMEIGRGGACVPARVAL